MFDYNSGCFFLTNFGDFLLTRNGYNRLTLTPTSSSILLDDINIGLYRYLKDENGHKKGEIREIPTRTESAGDVNGIAGGNGTSNPIIAYGITETGAGYIETAQLK